MKKLVKLLIVNTVVLTILAICQYPVAAASFSVSRSASSVSPGGKFTVTVSCPSGAGQFSVSASNGTVSNSSIWVDNGSASVSVTAGSSGTVTVTVSATDVTANDESAITGSRSVSVSIQSASTNNQNSNNNSSQTNQTNGNNTDNTQKTEDNRSTVNDLSSLTVSQGTLSPSFDANITSYEVNVEADVTSLTFSAKAKDSQARVSGDGEKTLQIGDNTFQIVCAAENGSQKTYTVVVHVDEKPLVYVKYNDSELGFVRNLTDLAIPNTFEETTIKIADQEVKAYYSAQMDKTIVYLANEEGVKNFYLYDEKDGVTSIFIPAAILGRNVFIIDVKKNDIGMEDMKFQDLTIDNITLKGWVFNDKDYSHYSLIMVMNEKGEKVIYQYEDTENTLQLYRQIEEKEIETDQTSLYIFMLTTGIFALSTIASLVYLYLFKKKSISAIKAYYERRNHRF